MTLKTNRSPAGTREKSLFPLFAVLLVAMLALLFWRCFLPGIVHFNNDMPLGAMKSWSDHWLEGFSGRWADLNTVGGSIGAASPTLSVLFLGLMGAVGFAKFYAPFALLITGFGAWLFFRQLKLSPVACLLGGLAAALNSDFLATACWGVAAQPLSFGLCYMALAAVVSTSRPIWVRLPLAGLAVGMAVAEVPDIAGFIFAPLVGAFVVYYTLVAEGSRVAKRLSIGGLKLAVVVAFAAWMAIGVAYEIYGTHVKAIATFEDKGPEGKAAQWDWATQWSLPKRELLNVAVPGLFGYRMDSSAHGLKSGDYWGAGGRDPQWDRYFASGGKGPEPGGFIRYGGGGLYAGILVVVVGLWAAFQSFRGQASVFAPVHRKLIWFWLGVLVVSVFLSFGRYTAFFGIVYYMPGISKLSTYMRNPGKFMHGCEWALVVLFAYGVHGLTCRYAQAATTASKGLTTHLRGWWARVTGFDRKWTLGCLGTFALCVVGWLIYAQSRGRLEEYLQVVKFDPETAKGIAGFSIEQVGWFVLRLGIAVALVILMVSGWFAGARAKWGGILLGLFLVGDLAIANQPWIIYWDYPQKYATNPIIEQLRQRPYEGRTVILPAWMTSVFQVPPQLVQEERYLDQLYEIEWKQQLFQYYGIQSLDVVQMSRVPADWDAFENATEFIHNVQAHRGQPLQTLMPLVARHWQLTNTRYILGAVPFLDALNQALDPLQHRFRIASRFDIGPKPNVAQVTSLTELTAEPSTNGMFAVFEFTGTLPRAKLFTQWQEPAKDPAVVSQFINTNLGVGELNTLKGQGTNDFLTLKELASPSFDPEKTVLVAESPEPNLPAPATNAPSPGTVEFTSYAPKDIVLQAKATAPSVLLLNDKFDAGWKVTVDGKPETLLRCNYLMRGVQVPAGDHKVEFRFAPGAGTIWMSTAALGVAAVLLVLLGFVKASPAPAEPSSKAPEKGK